MLFTWFDPEELLADPTAAIVWSFWSMPRSHRKKRDPQADLDRREHTRAMLAALKACTVCGYCGTVRNAAGEMATFQYRAPLRGETPATLPLDEGRRVRAMEPLSTIIIAALTGGVSTKLAERAIDTVLPAFRDSDERARREAAENTRAMLERFGDRLDDLVDRVGTRGEVERLVAERLANPDFGFTFHQALLGAARTNSEVRHDILSRAVMERIVGAPESTQVVASGLAVEILGRLSGPQLDLLGVAAFLYYIAPVLHAPGKMPPPDEALPVKERDPAMIELARGVVTEYVKYIETHLPLHGTPSPITSMDFAHLVSASCASFDRTLNRDIFEILEGHDQEFQMTHRLLNSFSQRLPAIRLLPNWTALCELWTRGIQHLTIAPAGLIIGAVVHQYKTGENVDLRWDLAPSDASIDEGAWSPRGGINDRFYRELIRQLESDLESRRRAGGLGHISY